MKVRNRSSITGILAGPHYLDLVLMSSSKAHLAGPAEFFSGIVEHFVCRFRLIIGSNFQLQ